VSSVDDTRDLKVPQKVGYVNVLRDFGGPESIGVREVQAVSYFMFMVYVMTQHWSKASTIHRFLLSACTRVPHREGNSMGVIEPFSASLAQDGLAECDQPGKNPLKYSAVAGNRTRATGRTDSELFH